MRSKVKSALDFFPEVINLSSLREAAETCRGCHLYKNAIQTVFGAGKKNASLVVVGEIAGKDEDEKGLPFVGPAGKFLRKSLAESGLDEEDIYFTNVVKHFKFSYIRGKKLHRSPVGKEINACKPWLEAELEIVQPQLIMCLGATAAKTLISKNFRITRQRGKVLNFSSRTKIMATYHPSAILRAPDDKERHRMKRLFKNDIRKVVNWFA